MTDSSDPVAPAADPDPIVAALNGMASGQLSDRMGMVVTQASAQRMVATLPVAGNTQPYGLLHGGASAVLIEALGSIGAALHAATLGKIAVGVDLNATHHRGVSSGTVTGTAVPLHLGSTMASYQVTITDEQGRLVCTGRLSCLLRGAPPRPA